MLLEQNNLNEIKIIGKKKATSFMLDDIEAMTVLGRNKLNFYVDGLTYQLKGNKRFNPIKYMHYYYIRKNKKEGIENEFMGL